MEIQENKVIFDSPEEKARVLAYNAMKAMYEHPLDAHYVKIVWFNKTLQNWKAMVADISDGGFYCEVTYNGTKHETYVDVYRKIENVRIPD